MPVRRTSLGVDLLNRTQLVKRKNSRSRTTGTVEIVSQAHFPIVEVRITSARFSHDVLKKELALLEFALPQSTETGARFGKKAIRGSPTALARSTAWSANATAESI